MNDIHLDIQVTHFLVKYSNISYMMTSVPNLNIYHDTRDLKRTLVVESTNWRAHAARDLTCRAAASQIGRSRDHYKLRPLVNSSETPV